MEHCDFKPIVVVGFSLWLPALSGALPSTARLRLAGIDQHCRRFYLKGCTFQHSPCRQGLNSGGDCVRGLVSSRMLQILAMR